MGKACLVCLLSLALAGAVQINNKQLLSVFNQMLHKEDEHKDDTFGQNFNSLLQIGETIHSHVESGSRPPDETLVDTLTMMKSLLNQAQQQKRPSAAAEAAAAKQKAVKNIQKKLTANILKKLDNDAPMVEVAKKLKAISQYQPAIQDMERRMSILKKVEPILESAIKLIYQVIDVKNMPRAAAPQVATPVIEPEEVEAPTPPPRPVASASDNALAALLAQMQGQAAPVQQPVAAEVEPQAAAGGLGDLDGLLSQLSFVQMPTVETKKPNGIKFDMNPQDGKDTDGFEDTIFIQDDTNSEKGFNDAVLVDPLSQSATNKSIQELSQLQKRQIAQITNLKSRQKKNNNQKRKKK